MPFIEQKYRSSLDWYIRDAEDGKVWEPMLGLQKVLDDEKQIPKEIFDGALNYTICQLYRKANIAIAESIILMLLNKYFFDEPRYTKLKDAVGTLYSVCYAFREKLVETGVTTEDGVCESIDRLISYQKNRYVYYEESKKSKNGDLQ